MKDQQIINIDDNDVEDPLSFSFTLAFELANIAGLQLVADGCWIDTNGNIYSQQEAFSLLPALTL